MRTLIVVLSLLAAPALADPDRLDLDADLRSGERLTLVGHMLDGLCEPVAVEGRGCRQAAMRPYLVEAPDFMRAELDLPAGRLIDAIYGPIEGSGLTRIE